MPDLDRLSNPDGEPRSFWEATYDEAMTRAKQAHDLEHDRGGGGGGGSTSGGSCVVILLLMLAATAGLADAIWSVLA